MINIAIAPDDNYVMPATVALTSILENKKSELKIYMLSLENHFSKGSREIFYNLAEKYETQIEFIELKEDKLVDFPVLRHGLSAYLRMYTPELLPDIEKLLYLDCDIIVNEPLDDLFNINIEEYDMAGVMDLIQVSDPGFLKSIGCTSGHYVNTGVLLMNLKRLRRRNILGDTLTYLNLYKDLLRFSDQDILNGIIPNILLLPPKFNSTIHLWNPKVRHYCLKVWTEAEIEEGRNNPVVIHYISVVKPWHWGAKHPFRNKWFFYLKMTSFKDFKPIIDKNYLRYRFKSIKNIILSKIFFVIKLVTPQIILNYVHKKRTA